MSVPRAAESRRDAYVVRHRQSGLKVRRSEAERAREPERARVVGLVEIELLVLEADVEPVEDVGTGARAPGERVVAFRSVQVADRRRQPRLRVIPEVTDLPEELVPVAERQDADGVWRESVRVHGQPRVGDDLVARAAEVQVGKLEREVPVRAPAGEGLPGGVVVVEALEGGGDVV